MRDVRVLVARKMVPDPFQKMEYNIFEVPSTLEEAIKEARWKLRDCKCDQLPCTDCAMIEVLLNAVTGTE